LLDYVEIYDAETAKVLAEVTEDGKVTLFIFQENMLTELSEGKIWSAKGY